MTRNAHVLALWLASALLTPNLAAADLAFHRVPTRPDILSYSTPRAVATSATITASYYAGVSTGPGGGPAVLAWVSGQADVSRVRNSIGWARAARPLAVAGNFLAYLAPSERIVINEWLGAGLGWQQHAALDHGLEDPFGMDLSEEALVVASSSGLMAWRHDGDGTWNPVTADLSFSSGDLRAFALSGTRLVIWRRDPADAMQNLLEVWDLDGTDGWMGPDPIAAFPNSQASGELAFEGDLVFLAGIGSYRDAGAAWTELDDSAVSLVSTAHADLDDGRLLVVQSATASTYRLVGETWTLLDELVVTDQLNLGDAELQGPDVILANDSTAWRTDSVEGQGLLSTYRRTALSPCAGCGDLAPGELDEGTEPPTHRVEGDGRLDVGDVIVLLRAAVNLIQLDCD